MSDANPRYLEVRVRGAQVERGGRTVLRDIDWTVRPGERWVLAGSNGAGKTQLLKLIAGIVWAVPRPRQAAPLCWILGRERASTPFGVKDLIAYVGAERQDKYERYGWDATAARIVATGLGHSDIPLERIDAAGRRRVQRALAALGIAHLAARAFLSLSYGERRLVLIARALVGRPRLLLLDEVLNGLDGTHRRRLLRGLERLARGLPWVLATHRAADVPATATHVLLLERGRMVYAGRRRGAPLARCLAGGAATETGRAATGPGVRRRRRSAGPVLVRLAHATVYLDGRRVLEDVSLSVRAGEFWLVHGGNGAGKTTLLRTLYGDHGVAAGGCVARRGIAAGVPLERFQRHVGLIAPHLHPVQPAGATVAEVVQSGWYASIGLNDPPHAAARIAARRALAAFGLAGLAARRFAQLSRGQQRRVLFARAWACAPRLLLADEPLAGVDAATRRRLAARVRALAARGVAVVLTTHAAGEWRACGTHELEIAAGRVRYSGPLRGAAAVA